MQRVGDILAGKTIPAPQPMATRFGEAMAQPLKGIYELEKERAQRYNQTRGDLDASEYDCPVCLNRGHVCHVEMRYGYPYACYPECECMEVRRSIWRIKRSGLAGSVEHCTFKAFKTLTDWQQRMKDIAERYCAEGAENGAWLFYGGAVGCGKTHICTAVAGALMRGKHMGLAYMTWPSESTRIKAIINDDEEYAEAVWRLKNVRVLYIDDFFKPVKDELGRPKPPTAADVRLAYEVFNHRYINRLPTIISSERYLSEIEDIDLAISSRITERSRGYSMTIGRDREKNYRLKGWADSD